MGKLSRVALLYIGAVVVLAAVLVARGPFTGLSWQYVAVLGILVIVSESRATQLRQGELTWSPSSAAMLASVVLVGPVGAAIVGACTALGLRRGPHILQRVFNTAMYALSAYLAGRGADPMRYKPPQWRRQPDQPGQPTQAWRPNSRTT